MRVTGGTARGVVLRPPRSTAVRPTTDKVRAALFNILASIGIEDAFVADLYAGTGSLGIEALSRGAAHVDFVEADRRQVADIAANLVAAKVADRATVVHGTVEQALPKLGGYLSPRSPLHSRRGDGADADRAGGEVPRYHFILADPPYTRPFPEHVVEQVDTLGLLAEDGVLVVGHSSRVSVPESCGGLERWQDRRYGDSTLAFYRRRSTGKEGGEAA